MLISILIQKVNLSNGYGCIILSVVPLMFWDEPPFFWWIELFITTVFVMDYVEKVEFGDM